MSSLNPANQPDSKAFDDLLGRLVDELAMSPALPQPDPAPQLVRAPEPTHHASPGATPYVVPTNAPARPNRTPIAIAGIVAGSIVALGVAAMLILPGGTDEPSSPAPARAEAVAPAPAVAAPPPAPSPVPVVVPVPPSDVAPAQPADTTSDATDDGADAPAPPAKKPKKTPNKHPPKKTPPNKSGDGFDDM
jgi:hypothetical protein